MMGVTPHRTGSCTTSAGRGGGDAIQDSLPALRGLLRRFVITGSAALLVMGATTFVRAGILESVPIQAYAGDPQLNPGRTDVRATDETVAHAGYCPTVAVLADLGVAYSERNLAGRIREQTTLPGAAGITVNQTLFNHFQTDNETWQAESTVYSERETLRLIELITLFNAAQAYRDVLRDTANLQRQRNTVEELEKQLRQTRDRFNVNEVTRTDVALAEMRLAGARSQVARPRRSCASRSAPIGASSASSGASSSPAGSSTVISRQASMLRSKSVSRSTSRSWRRCTRSMPRRRG